MKIKEEVEYTNSELTACTNTFRVDTTMNLRYQTAEEESWNLERIACPNLNTSTNIPFFMCPARKLLLLNSYCYMIGQRVTGYKYDETVFNMRVTWDV
jgi:hypothetical protein